MHDENMIVRDRQRLIRRQMDARGILVKQVQLDGGWETPSTVQSYFPADPSKEPATMSVASLYRLIEKKALPVDLLSLLLPPGHLIVRAPEGVDYDEISAFCRDFVDTKERAHHPESECGRDLGPGEKAELSGKVVRLRSVAA